jgi:hypothetical protein
LLAPEASKLRRIAPGALDVRADEFEQGAVFSGKIAIRSINGDSNRIDSLPVAGWNIRMARFQWGRGLGFP